MPRPIQARIDLSALRHNCALVRSKTPSARIWAVLKADAYGHGLLRVARSLAANVEGFAVLELSAAITLRNAGLKHPIMLLEGCFEPADLELCAEYGLTPAVHHLEQLRMFAAVGLKAPLPINLKINTGMNRLGFTAAELPAVQAMPSTVPSRSIRTTLCGWPGVKATSRDSVISSPVCATTSPS